MFLSIIVPVYNTSEYLSRCIDSLLKQGLNEGDYEILLVNDGSTDNSLAICQEYESHHPQVKVVDKENGGVSSARNRGMELARGRFVCFVDSDDYVLEGGYGYIKQHFDIESFDLVRFWSAIEAKGSDRPKELDGKVNFKGTGHEYIQAWGLESYCYVALYRLDFLKQNNIVFRPYRVCEDALFASTVLLANPRMISTTSRIYRYVIHSNTLSTCRDQNFMRLCVNNQLDVHDELMHIIKSLKYDRKSVFFKHAEGFLHSLMPFLISRALSAGLSVGDFKQLATRCHNQKLWPLPFYANMTKKVRLYSHAINFLDRHPRFFPMASFLYMRFFVPFILKRLDRNFL